MFGEAKWTQSDSAFCQELASRLNHDVRFEPYSWQGTNSNLARLNAGHGLAETMRNRIRKYPSSKHLIVAHSHGGNVALYALGWLSEAERGSITGLVTLATPFIHVQKRDVDQVRSSLSTCTWGGVIAWLLVALVLFLFNAYVEPLGTFSSRVLILAVVIAVLGLATLLILARYRISAWRQAANYCEQQIAAIAPPNISVLCIRANRDEASIWVRAVEWVGDQVFGDWLLTILQPVVESISSLEVFGGGKSSAFRAAGNIPEIGPGVAGIAGVMLYSYYFTLLLASLASALVLGAVVLGTLVTVVSPWGYGADILMPWVVRFWIAELPMNCLNRIDPGRNDFLSLGLSAAASRDWEPLSTNATVELRDFSYGTWSFHHSAVYVDPRVVDAIDAWAQQLSSRTDGTPNISIGAERDHSQLDVYLAGRTTAVASRRLIGVLGLAGALATAYLAFALVRHSVATAQSAIDRERDSRMACCQVTRTTTGPVSEPRLWLTFELSPEFREASSGREFEFEVMRHTHSDSRLGEAVDRIVDLEPTLRILDPTKNFTLALFLHGQRCDSGTRHPRADAQMAPQSDTLYAEVVDPDKLTDIQRASLVGGQVPTYSFVRFTRILDLKIIEGDSKFNRIEQITGSTIFMIPGNKWDTSRLTLSSASLSLGPNVPLIDIPLSHTYKKHQHMYCYTFTDAALR